MANLSSTEESAYLIQVGDILDVHFHLSPELDDEVAVRPDGKITLRLAGEMQAKGRTPSELAGALDDAYARELRTPGATVLVKSTPSWRVYVDGEVTHPGAFPLEPEMSAEQAIALAGGITPEAAPKRALLIRRDLCGTPTGIKFDLAKAQEPEGTAEENVAMLPGDIVYVPRSAIADVDLFVKHYVRDVLPVEPYLAVPGS
jgi:protein involved in polysaccharide export with SLBB domain